MTSREGETIGFSTRARAVATRSLTVLRSAFSAWMRHDASSLSAAMAYYAAFATAPTLVLLVGALGALLGRGSVRAHVLAQAREAMGLDGEAAVALFLDNASRPTSVLTAVVSVGTILVSTTGLFAELSRSLDQIWEVPPPTGSIAVAARRRWRARHRAFFGG